MATFREIAGGGVTAPEGFLAGAASCGIKNPDSDKLDLMILSSAHPTVTAATFTSNRVQAAPVRVTREHLATEDDVRAVIVSSGNANACTGAQGMADAREMAALAAERLNLRPSQVAVCSTGVIGKPLPMERIRPKIDEAATLGDDPLRPTLAIMTSDTVPKYSAVELPIGDRMVRIGAMTKGAGMICPNMATMLCFVTTDAAVDPDCLQALTKRAVDRSFNRITIDGDMSTNDTVLVMANGQAGNAVITVGTPEAEALGEALRHVLLGLAKAMIRDAEKATRFIELEVRGARTEPEAHTVAKAVANSVLVKCMWNGGQPYWGRVMHAIGYSGVDIVEERIAIDFNDVPAARGGISAGTPVEVMREETDQAEHRLVIDLGLGEAGSIVYTSDISEKFVEFNLLD